MRALYKWFIILRDQTIFWYYKRMAEAKHNSDGMRYWVIRTDQGILVVNKYQINEANRKLSKAERMDIKKLLENALYRTK